MDIIDNINLNVGGEDSRWATELVFESFLRRPESIPSLMGQVNYICTSEPVLVNVYGAHESMPHAMLMISALLKRFKHTGSDPPS